MNKGTCCQVWGREFNQATWWRKEPTPANYSLTSIHVFYGIHTNTHTQTHTLKNIQKLKMATRWSKGRQSPFPELFNSTNRDKLPYRHIGNKSTRNFFWNLFLFLIEAVLNFWASLFHLLYVLPPWPAHAVQEVKCRTLHTLSRHPVNWAASPT